MMKMKLRESVSMNSFHFVGSARLREREQWVQALLNASTVGVAIIDRNYCYCGINDTLARMNGVPASHHLGRKLADILPSRLARRVEARLATVFESKKPIINAPIGGETRSGRRGNWREDFYPIWDSNTDVIQVMVIVVDATAEWKLNRLLEKVTGELHSDRKGTLRQARPVESFIGSAQDVSKRGELQKVLAKMLELLQAISVEGSVQLSTPRAQENFGNGSLSTRQREVAQLIALGKSNKEIACELRISIRTVEAHRAHLMRKLELRTAVDVARYAIRSGLASP